ncbi:MAG: hypothetical protein WCY59_08700, partial [Anaerovoracaceae bacterium]
YKLVGKPVITKDKPGEQIAKVLAEIQEKAITYIEAQNNPASGGTPAVNIKISTSKNKVTISATVDNFEPGDVLPNGTEQYQVLAWDGAKWVADFVRAT